MSHFTRLKTRIRDIEALMSCLREMGYRVEKGGTIGGFEGKRAVDVAVRMAQGYDVGFTRGRDGFYEVVADWWGVQEAKQGELTKQLEIAVRRQYAISSTLQQLQTQGFNITDRTQLKDGAVRIVARRWR